MLNASQCNCIESSPQRENKAKFDVRSSLQSSPRLEEQNGEVKSREKLRNKGEFGWIARMNVRIRLTAAGQMEIQEVEVVDKERRKQPFPRADIPRIRHHRLNRVHRRICVAEGVR